jgi:hypothetical protein
MRRSRSFLALLLIVLIVVPTLLAQTDPIPLPPDGQDTGTPSLGRLPPPLTLLSPADGAVEVEPLPVFRWTAHPDRQARQKDQTQDDIFCVRDLCRDCLHSSIATFTRSSPTPTIPTHCSSFGSQ